jgi:prepilin-type N-terminal cleavage/methylation domain-containing protein
MTETARFGHSPFVAQVAGLLSGRSMGQFGDLTQARLNRISMMMSKVRFKFRAIRRGFTLIETALASIIVGVGIVATMQLFATCTMDNRSAAQMSTAAMLANNVHEAMLGAEVTFADPGTAHRYFGPEPGESLATFDDLDDFDGASMSPPIDSLRKPIASLSEYTQVVSVWPVYPNKLSVNSNESNPDIPNKSTYTGALRVRVRILHRATPGAVPREVYRTSWVHLDN